MDNLPDSRTCQGGQYKKITDNYGCTVEWRCEGGTSCPVVVRPDRQCNGTWEPQYSTSTQCLTHYFCDKIPPNCTMEYTPVCGELNGRSRTYTNKCLLGLVGAQLLYEGQCSPYPGGGPVINRFNGPSALQVGKMGTWKVSASGGSKHN